MPNRQPSKEIWHEAAKKIGCDVAAIAAVFEVEASGKFFNADGTLPQRFEPHHFPKSNWSAIGFDTAGKAPWRASLALSHTQRMAMFEKARRLDDNAALEATSWGAPQIMGYNYRKTGHESAAAMIKAMRHSADEQINCFVGFVVNTGLGEHLRNHDWVAFATGYNGPAQPKFYAGKIVEAYKKQNAGTPLA